MAEPDPDLLTRARGMVDRTIQRNIKGLEFLTAPPAKVGLTPKEVIYERGTLRLYHYLPQTDEIYRVLANRVMHALDISRCSIVLSAPDDDVGTVMVAADRPEAGEFEIDLGKERGNTNNFRLNLCGPIGGVLVSFFFFFLFSKLPFQVGRKTEQKRCNQSVVFSQRFWVLQRRE